jgi:hypothetical protein
LNPASEVLHSDVSQVIDAETRTLASDLELSRKALDQWMTLDLEPVAKPAAHGTARATGTRPGGERGDSLDDQSMELAKNLRLPGITLQKTSYPSLKRDQRIPLIGVGIALIEIVTSLGCE